MMRVTPTWLATGVRWCERAVFALPGVAPHAPRRNAIVVLLYLLLLFVAVNVVDTLFGASLLSVSSVGR